MISYQDVIDTPMTDAHICVRLSVQAVTLIQFLLSQADTPSFWEDYEDFSDEIDALIADVGIEGLIESEACMWAIGDIKESAVDAVPDNWLRCDGSSLAIAEYPDLFAAIGVQFGAEDEDHFSIPDFRMRSPMGDGALEGNPELYGTYPIGFQAGDIKNIIQIENMPAHHHGSAAIASGSGGFFTAASPYAGTAPATGWNTFDTGGNEPFNVTHPVQVIRVLIKAL